MKLAQQHLLVKHSLLLKSVLQKNRLGNTAESKSKQNNQLDHNVELKTGFDK